MSMDFFTDHQEALSPLTIAGCFAALFLVYQLCTAVHAVYFHPLRSIPGPWYTAVSRIPYARSLLDGSTVVFLKNLHARYGPVVRYSPNEVSFTNGDEVWQDIYGFRTGKSKNTGVFLKDPVWYAPGIDNIPGMLVAGEQDHGRQRRVLSHAFSDKALRSQEGLIMTYADLLVNRLKEAGSAADMVQDLTKWYDWTTFDIIADLVFGEPFGCLAGASTHDHIELILKSIKAFGLMYVMQYWPFVKQLGGLIIPKGTMAKRKDFHQFVRASVQKRVESETQRPDFMTHILAQQRDEEAQGNSGITMGEIISNSATMLVAGTETTATTLSSTTYQILRHPEIYQKLKDEVRGRFKSDDELTIDNVNDLTYMIAVLNEALRIMPPVPAGFIRKVPPTGGMVGGYFIPGDCNASVSMTQAVSYHDEKNFKDPLTFAPERWLGDNRFEDDNRATFQPFSFGPRNCIGKNLAYAEMRLIMAKMIFHFDMELEPTSQDWTDRLKVLALWVKPPLMVKLTPVTT